MKIKLVVSTVLLVFVAASFVYLVMKGSAESDLERAAERAAENSAAEAESGSKVIAYYFHGNARCKTCLTIELYAIEAIEAGFPEALRAGTLEFVPVNLDVAANEHFIDDFQLAAKTVVLERIVEGKRKDFVNLVRVWELVGDKEAYFTYIQDETEKFMNGES